MPAAIPSQHEAFIPAAAYYSLFLIPTVVFSQTLSYQTSLSKSLAANPLTSSSGNVHTLFDSSTGENVEIAYFPYLVWFTCENEIPDNTAGAYDGVASISLAMEHLNTGNGTIVPEINELDQKCPLRFTTKSFDTECQQHVAVNHVISLTDRIGEKELYPLSILGAMRSSISMSTSIVSGIRDVPQISPGSTSSTLDDKGQYNLFGRTVPSDDGPPILLLAKLKSWGVNHLAVLYTDDSYGVTYSDELVLAAKRMGSTIQIQTVNILSHPDDAAIRNAVQKLVETQYTYFFGVIYSTHVNAIMSEAYDQGIAGTGLHNWIFSDGLGSHLQGGEFEAGSKLAMAFRGIGILTPIGGISGMTNYDKLNEAMQEVKANEADLSYVESLFPTDYSDGKVVNHSIISRDEAFLSTPKFASPFLYDAVIALGLAACELRSRGGGSFTGVELFQAFKETTFNGTTGLVVFDNRTGTRDPNSAVFLLKNYIYDEDATESDMVQFKSVDTDVHHSGKGEILVPYTFNDGTNSVPPDLPPLDQYVHYPKLGFKVVGGIYCSIIFILSIGFGIWTYINRNKQVLRSSQPLFLYIISAGTLFMGSVIIPISCDLSVTSEAGADVACMSIPWLFMIGFSLTFSALFTKTYRVNQIIKNAAQFRRVKITAVDVMKPMVALLLVNIVILTAWSLIDPLQRETIVVRHDSFGRDGEVYDRCTSEHVMAFLGALGIINTGCLLVALWQAYEARKISTELQESSYIFVAMAMTLMISFIGIPVIIIAQENRSTAYFLATSVVFVICTSILVLIYVPKWKADRKKKKNRRHSANNPLSSIASNATDDAGINIISCPQHIEELEKKVSKLREENLGLKRENEIIIKDREKMEKEYNELKKLLGNDE